MVQRLYRDARLDKGLDAIRCSGKKGAVAAARADEIIGLLNAQGFIRTDQLGPCLRRTDARIPNCVKYYLGYGFRMITVEDGRDLYLLHIGTHDACHRWMENNRRFRGDAVRQRSAARRIEWIDPGVGGNPRPDTSDEPEPGDPFPDPDDRLLRKIFAGLCGNTA